MRRKPWSARLDADPRTPGDQSDLGVGPRYARGSKKSGSRIFYRVSDSDAQLDQQRRQNAVEESRSFRSAQEKKPGRSATARPASQQSHHGHQPDRRHHRNDGEEDGQRRAAGAMHLEDDAEDEEAGRHRQDGQHGDSSRVHDGPPQMSWQ